MAKTVKKLYGWEITTFRNKDGDLHNARGPALKTDYGAGHWEHTWYISGLKHRRGGPAEEYSDGRKWWYESGQLHRLDGPAVVFPQEDSGGPGRYWVNGVSLTKDQFSLEQINAGVASIGI